MAGAGAFGGWASNISETRAGSGGGVSNEPITPAKNEASRPQMTGSRSRKDNRR